MKRTIEWLMELPEGYRERALKAKIQTPNIRSLRGAINCFSWSSTKEGICFWDEVDTHLMDREEPLPPLDRVAKAQALPRWQYS